ncbi:hypothetical protein SCHPADRAFT_93146 [Schizopora paradoxa]|uniref:Uncharacterized protein n=1 Tax=Schizopora paradoxa TaxID=27342 RepID=A0A0H2SPC7_9AGAM|nr:hypothetical protein SCHPADRAFT_93146 [Schizopora paradoxa]
MEPHQDWTPFETPPSFLSVLSSFAHFLIPVYAIFLYEAPISLRIWLAMKAAERGDLASSTGEFKKNDTDENLNPNRIPWAGRVMAALKDSTLLIEIMKLLVFVAVIIDIVLTSFRVEVSMKNTVYFALMFIPAGAACVKVSKNPLHACLF